MANATANHITLQNLFNTRLDEEKATLESAACATFTVHELQSRLQDLEFEFDSVRQRHEKIILAKSVEASKTYLDEQVYSKIRTKYYMIWGLMSERLPKSSSTTEVFNSTVNPHSRTMSEVKLQRIDLPTFSGKYEEWMAFDNMFTAAVHNNDTMEPIVKLQRLKAALTGDAELIVRNLQLKDENYNVARTLLRNRYHHTRRLVNSYLKKIYDLPAIKTESAKTLQSMLNILNECTSALKQLELVIEDYQLVYHMSRKLPQSFLTAWEESQGASTSIPTYTKFLQFLETRFRMMEMIEPSGQSSKSFHVSSNKTQGFKNRSKKPDKKLVKSKVQGEENCIVCHGNHKLFKCEKFKAMSQHTRFETVKSHKMCYNCLDNTHSKRDCRSKYVCRVCKDRHHTLLHRYQTNNTEREPTSNVSNSAIPASAPTHSGTYHVNSRGITGSLLGTAQVRAMGSVGLSIVVRALIDPCSEDNYILSSTVQTLHLKKYFSPSVIGVLGDSTASNCDHRVDLFIKSMDDNFTMKISAGVIDSITSDLPSIHLPLESFGFFNSLTLADPRFNEPNRVELLLGINVHTQIMLNNHKRLGNNLIAENTLLGYLIRGQALVQTDRPSLVMMTKSSTAELNSQIKKFWEIEEVNNVLKLHPDDALCEEIFLSSIRQDSDGHLEMDLPFKENKLPVIGPSRYMAVKRFLSLERKLKSNENLRKEYHNTISNYLNSNHLSKVTFSPTNGYYLPHHAVVKESSTTTKVRVVFDASCRSLDGFSLNDHLLTGPKLQHDIRDILFKWRQYPFALTSDIEKMYRMFKINPKHHEYQKIVWRFDENGPIEDYVLKTATFGTSCAPFLAIRCLQYIADLHVNSHPLTANAIRNEFYVDDFISGGFSIEEAIEKQTTLRSIFERFNLSLRKWSSNNKQTLSNIPIELLDTSKEQAFDETDFRKTLGIFWSQERDSFFFSISPSTDMQGNFTKRKILSLIARLYDPLGWVSPCTMLAKQIMQKVWQTNVDWDDTVDSSITTQFKEFLSQLTELKDFSIPRWTHIVDSNSPLTIFGFSDASDKGYSAVVYLLDPKPNGIKPSLILLTSKTKVADLKFQSTARLELNGALLLSELLKWTVQLYKPRRVEVNAFCDSKIVLAWLQGHPSKWKTYIANRTSQILEWMEPSQWKYIDTKLNPADCASRGILPRELLEHSLWLNGPNLEVLQTHELCHLDEDQKKTVEEAIKRNSLVLHATKVEPLPILTYFSNHYRLVKRVSSITAFIKQIMSKLLKKNCNHIERFKQVMIRLESSENVVFRMLQREYFNDEISTLHSGKELKSNSTLKGLHPFVDSNGILRVGGRLTNADLSFDQRHPIILPKRHQVVKNLISEAHEKTMHGTELLTSAYLRNRFHIPRASEKVRNLIHGCMKCFRFSRQQHETLMGSLPEDRVKITAAFEHTGVDYAGPITMKAYAGRCKKFMKGYIAIFICLCTKAIHIEPVSDLSSLAFLAAFKRFCATRGRCLRLYSDNGTNFVGADKILRTEILLAEKTWKTDLVKDLKDYGTEWKFIPPASPNFGGLWEAAVKSMKSHLKKTIGSSLLTFEEMDTVLKQIAAVLNSRPLCPLSNNPNEYSFLTPAHFLIGRPQVAPPEKCHEMDKISTLQRWHHVQAIYQRFTRLWKRDYLHNLINRPKGQKTTIHYKTGDLVLLTDDDTPPTLWPTVIIDKIHPGKDGIVRVATVRAPSGKILKRPVSKLRFLPCNLPFEI